MRAKPKPVIYSGKREFGALPRADKARAYALALGETNHRYLHGMVCKATWKKHIRALWGNIEDRGLTGLVKAIVCEGMPK